MYSIVTDGTANIAAADTLKSVKNTITAITTNTNSTRPNSQESAPGHLLQSRTFSANLTKTVML